MDARIPPGRRGLAPPAQLGPRVLEAADGLRPGGGPARAQVAGEVQRRRPRPVGGAPLRAGARSSDSVASRPAVPGHLRRSSVPEPVPAVARHSGRTATDAGVVPRGPDPHAALGARGRVAPPARRATPPGTRDGGAAAPGGAERRARPLQRPRPIAGGSPQAVRADDAAVSSPADGAAPGPPRARADTLASPRRVSARPTLAADTRPLVPARAECVRASRGH